MSPTPYRGFEVAGVKRMIDPTQPVNRVVFSRFLQFDCTARMEGLSAKFVVEGEERYEVEGREYCVKPGQFLLVNHGQRVSVRIASPRPVRGVCLYFSPGRLRQALPGHTVPELPVGVYPGKGSALGPSLHQLSRWNDAQFASHPELFWELSLAMARQIQQTTDQRSRIGALRRSTREELHRRILLGVSYLHDNLDRKILVPDVARAAMLSEFHFLRTFKKVMGISPMQYLHRLRMDRARELLNQGRLSVSEVAIQCGFSDAQYFSRCYRRYYGCPPSLHKG